MNIDALQTFVVIADAGGITPAALRLGTSKSIVSRRLSRLEAQLGVQLLARTTRGSALTEAGAMFREHAARACAEIGAARDALLPLDELHGRLHIAAPLSLCPLHVAPALAEMARRHPRLVFHTCYSEQAVNPVEDGYDCVIRLGPLEDSGLVARRIGSVQGTLVASPGYIAAHGAPDTPQELGAHEALMQGCEAWQVMDGSDSISIRPRGRFKADTSTALVAAALAGIGVACLPNGLIREHLSAGALVPVMTRYPMSPAGAWVVRPPGRHPPRKVRILIDLLVDYFDLAPAGVPVCAT